MFPVDPRSERLERSERLPAAPSAIRKGGQREGLTRTTLYWALVTLCFAAGIAARFYGAWACRYVSNPDTGIVALMVKHMAEGREWPVFFYGQAYMGALEPMVSALLARLLGTTGFAVNAGTALVAVCTLPVIFRWAYEAAGKAGALAALALCAVGPHYYFMFQFAPRGGYAVTLLLGLLVMWLGARTAARIHAGGEPARGWFFLIGLLAGLGWWTNQLIAAALAAAATVLAIGLRGRIWRSGPWFGLLGFAIGSLPFWLWNGRHHWASFDLLAGMGTTDARLGLRLLWQRYDRLIGLNAWPPAARAAVLAAYPAGVASGIVAGAIGFRERKFSLASASAVTLTVFVLASLAAFVRSSFATMNTARYLIPLVPAGAILTGFLVRRLRTAAGPWVAALPVCLLVATHWPAIPELGSRSAAAPRQAKRDVALGTFLAKRDVQAAYSHFMDHTLNFNLHESVVVTDLRGDRYAPYARRAEMADRIAVLRNFGRINNFRTVAGGTMDTRTVGGYTVAFGFSPPTAGLLDVTDSALTGVVDRAGTDIRTALTDRNVDTEWIGRHPPGRPEWLELRFDGPTTVRCLRLFSLGAQAVPARARVEMKREGAERWETLHRSHIVTDYFWSGPRLYWGGRRRRLEYRLKDVSVTALRVVCEEPRGTEGAWRISELRCYGPGPELPSEAEALPDLLKLLHARGVRALYCDRWVANRVHAATGGSVRVELEPDLFPDSPLRGGSAHTLEQTAFLVQQHDLAATRSVLARHGIETDEADVGPWTLVSVRPDAAGSAAVRAAAGLYWTGCSLLHCNEPSPATPVAADFPRGIRMLGFTVAPREAEPGGELAVTWFWRLEHLGRGSYPAVFVHFQRGRDMFQDDHPFFGPDFSWRAADGGRSYLLWNRRILRVPADAAPGPRDIRVGLYDPVYGRRLRPSTSLPTHRRAVILKNALAVIEPPPPDSGPAGIPTDTEETQP